jgi:hypothetical protein
LLEFKHTNGRIPDFVYADPSMWIKRKIGEATTQSPAEDFESYGFNIVPANNDRINGWRTFNKYLKISAEGITRFGYFAGFNDNFEKYIPIQIHSKTNVEDLQKCDIDHVADECRYALMGHDVDNNVKLEDYYSTDYFKEESIYNAEA